MLQREGFKSLSLAEASQHLLEECRMVLPGIQALFGFQLIAVFNARFATALTDVEQYLHLLSLALVALSAVLVMAPASYHRQVEPHSTSDHFIHLSSRLLLLSMWPLAGGISLDFFLIARLITHREGLSAVLATGLFLVIAMLWFVLPRLWKRARPGYPAESAAHNTVTRIK